MLDCSTLERGATNDTSKYRNEAKVRSHSSESICWVKSESSSFHVPL